MNERSVEWGSRLLYSICRVMLRACTEWKRKLFCMSQRSLIGGRHRSGHSTHNRRHCRTTLNMTTTLQVSIRAHTGCWCEQGMFRGVWGEIFRGTGGDYCWKTWGRRMSEQPERLWQTTQFIPHSCWKHKANIPCCSSRMDRKKIKKKTHWTGLVGRHLVLFSSKSLKSCMKMTQF